MTNQFFRIVVFADPGAPGLTDPAGNHIDGNCDGTPGDAFANTMARARSCRLRTATATSSL